MLKDELEENKRKLKTSEEEKEKMRNEMISTHNLVCTLQDNNETNEVQNGMLQQELEHLRKKVSDTELELQTYKKKSDILRQDLRSFKDGSFSSRPDRESTQEEVRLLRNELQTNAEKYQELERFCKDSEDEKMRLQKELLETHTKASEMVIAHQYCHQEKNALQDEIASLKQRLRDLEDKQDDSKDKADDLQDDLLELHRKLSRAETMYEQCSRRQQQTELRAGRSREEDSRS